MWHGWVNCFLRFQWYLAEPIRIDPDDGCMPVPQGPGFGVELDEDKIRRFAVAR